MSGVSDAALNLVFFWVLWLSRTLKTFLVQGLPSWSSTPRGGRWSTVWQRITPTAWCSTSPSSWSPTPASKARSRPSRQRRNRSKFSPGEASQKNQLRRKMTKSFSACYFEASLSLCIELIPRGARNLSMSQNCISHNLWRHGFFQTSTFSSAIFPTFNTQVTDPFLGKMNVGSQNGYSNNMGNYRPPLIWLFMLFPPYLT